MSFDFPSFHLTKLAMQKFRSKSFEDRLSCALYLRMATEARLMEYASHRKEISEKKRQGHKIKKLKKEIDKHFQNQDRVLEMNTGNSKWYFTPVIYRQTSLCEHLGNWLHFNNKYEVNKEVHFEELLKVNRELLGLTVLSNLGALIAPPYQELIDGEYCLHVPFRITDVEAEYHKKGLRSSNDNCKLSRSGSVKIPLSAPC